MYERVLLFRWPDASGTHIAALSSRAPFPSPLSLAGATRSTRSHLLAIAQTIGSHLIGIGCVYLCERNCASENMVGRNVVMEVS